MNEIRPTAKLRRRIKACSVLVAASVIGGIAAANVAAPPNSLIRQSTMSC